MIEVQGVTKEYSLTRKEKQAANATDLRPLAVSDVSFICQPGRVFALLGPNGAGKTTILRMIACILAPSHGSITVAGHDTKLAPNEARRQMGFLTGSTGLYDRLTVNELLKYFADLFDVSAVDFKRRKEQVYNLLDMGGFANKRCGTLSTGIHDPQVVVFDEPTSGLDVISAENIINLVHDLRNQGKTVIFSSHNMSEVDLLADDLAIIHRGKLVVNDTMAAFRSQMQDPSLTKEFIRIIKTASAS
jgi:sodium transport system ATP-binding protein